MRWLARVWLMLVAAYGSPRSSARAYRRLMGMMMMPEADAFQMSHETRNIEELSDAKRALVLDNESGVITVYRQPGGCLEVNQPNPERRDQDIIHVCNIDQWRALAAAMIAVADRVPVRH